MMKIFQRVLSSKNSILSTKDKVFKIFLKNSYNTDFASYL
jgi:hypothetical protein